MIFFPRFRKNMRLKNLISLTSVFLVLFSSSLLSSFLFRYMADLLRESTYVSSSDMSTQISRYFDDRMRSVLNRMFALRSHDQFRYNSSFGNFLFHNEDYYYAVAQTKMSEIFSEIKVSEPFIHSIFIFTEKGEFHDLTHLRIPDVNFKETELFRRILRAEPKPVLWISRMRDEIYTGGREVIPIAYPFFVEGYLPQCYMVVNLDTKLMAAYLEDVYPRGNGSIIILGREDDVLLSSWNGLAPIPPEEYLPGLQEKEEGKQQLLLRKEGGNYIVTMHSTVVAPWKIVIINSEKQLNSKLSEAGLFATGLAFISIFVSFLIAMLLSRGITRPLSELDIAMQKVTHGQFDVKFEYGYNNEVGRLGRSFNYMRDEIGALISQLNETIAELHLEKERVRNEQILKRMAELKALQAQINPHFLYNTLNSIIWMADQAGADEIGIMAEHLGRFFRISLSDGKELIPLKDELEHVERYLAIQKVRYGSRLDYRIDSEKDIESFPVVKLTLQPFVENAIYHGIRDMKEAGFILITGKRVGDKILLTVEDNGVGIVPPSLEALRRRLAVERTEGAMDDQEEWEEGYGIHNVDERIKLYFGREFGVSLSSTLGEGTVVTVTVPAVDGRGKHESPV